jgi:hypothetical protein
MAPADPVHPDETLERTIHGLSGEMTRLREPGAEPGLVFRFLQEVQFSGRPVLCYE